MKGGKRPVKKFHNIIGIICLTIFALSCDGQNSSNYQLVEKFDPQRNASQDLTLAIAEAKMSNRNILLDVGGEW